MTIPKGLAARAVIETNTMKSKIVIEVREGARFVNFYQTYKVAGCGRNRTITPGLSRHRGFADSLEDAVEQIEKAIKAHAKRQKVNLIIHKTIRVHRKRLYRKLLAMHPDELGLTNVARKFGTPGSPMGAHGVLLSSYLSLAKEKSSLPVNDEALQSV